MENGVAPNARLPASSQRRIGLWSAVALIVANMVGSGVFTTSGFALADLGTPERVLVAWLVGGVFALLGALSYGAFARRVPESGGEYTFLSVAIHPAAGFVAGWVSLLAGFTAPIAAAALGLQAYLAAAFQVEFRPEWIGTAAILLAAVVHAMHLGTGVAVQNLAVVAKLATTVAFIVVGAWASSKMDALPALVAVPEFQIGAFAVTLVWISFAYSGWNAAVYVAGEVRDPERNLPRSLWLATALVTAVYLALNAVFVYAAPVAALAGKAEVGAIAAEALGGPALRRALSGIVALALFTSISSMVMAGPRVYARMADDGLFPQAFRSSPRGPVAAILLQAGLAIVVVWNTELAQLLSYIGFTLGLSAATTVVGLMLMRRAEGPERVPVPGYPWVPLGFVAGTAGTLIFMATRRPAEAAAGLATIGLGLLLYMYTTRRSPSSLDARR